MELSEAKEILKDMKDSMKQSKKDITIESVHKACEDSVEAIDTVLKALDNSISKDEVRKIVEQKVERLIHSKSAMDFIDNDEWTLEQLKKLLGEE